MAIEITKPGIDLGIVVRNADAALAFYRDVLGLPHVGTMPLPGGGTMERLQCGDTVLKIVSPAKVPDASNPPNGLRGGTGLRYFTITVADLEAAVAACEAAGTKMPMGITEIRAGVRIAMVEDPDGNWVEFLHIAAA